MARRSSDKPGTGSAYEKAVALLARREHSARELKSKLERRGFDPDQVATTVARLQSKNYQDDARFGEMLVRTRIEGGYGPRWIAAELATHGVSEATAGNLIETAAPDWVELSRRQLRRRYGPGRPATPAERRKRTAFLLRRGFDAATVRLALGSPRAGAADEGD